MWLNPLGPHDALKHHLTSLILDFRTKLPMKLVYQYMALFCNFYTTSNHLHPLQVENCDSNSRLVVDEDDNGKFRLERVNSLIADDVSDIPASNEVLNQQTQDICITFEQSWTNVEDVGRTLYKCYVLSAGFQEKPEVGAIIAYNLSSLFSQYCGKPL